MSKESEHYCQYCGNSNQRVNYAPVGSGDCIFGCQLDCYKQVSPFDTCKDWKPRKPFPVAWLNGYNGLVPYEDYPEHDVQLGLIDREAQ